MSSNSKYQGRRSFIILVIVAIALWFVFDFKTYIPIRQSADPRPVAARGDLAEDEKNTIDIFRNTSPSVVYITSIALRRGLFSLNAVEIPQGTGSGFVWDREGRIVTNYHVISDAGRIQVTMADQNVYKAVLVGADPDKDLAVLEVNAPDHALLPIPVGESTNLLVGQKVFAIGNPFGLDHTITSGIISALGREIQAITGRTIRGVIQTDAAINPGNSGGPLLDSAGRLIGVNTAIFSPSGAYAGIGFAVPVEEINRVVPQLISHGKLIKPGIGASLADERIAGRLGVEGILILDVEKNGPADLAGLRPTRQYRGDIVLGDIIVEVSGDPVKSYDDVRTALEKHSVGESVEITFIREGQLAKTVVELIAIN
ncbi:MAG: trypsin-like peptidase domain-containing protein [Desulfocapsaceae bacterium]|jgi:S1-C subfamily serine protease|nr:trypsin-like peptidase domain-containing protein [Desulfocapsaceae bacterium]